jgi:Mg/Co/Ni transporter MgtE
VVPDFGKEWLTPAQVDRISELLSRLPRNRRRGLIDVIDDPTKRRRLLRQQQYPPHTVGSLLADVPLRVVETAKAGDVVRAIRDLGGRNPGLLVVISPEGVYRGVLDPWPLVANTQGMRLSDHVVRVEPLLPEIASVDAADDERWNDFAWLPVADHEGHVLGRVARSRILKAAREESVDALRRQDFITSLFAEFVYLCGGTLERLLVRTTRR